MIAMSSPEPAWRPSATGQTNADAAQADPRVVVPQGPIVHVFREPEISGSQRVALDILGDPALSGYRRVVICGGEALASARFVGELARSGIERIHLDSLCRDIGLRDLRTLRDLRRIFRQLQPALVHTHSAKPYLLAGLAACMEGVPRRVHTLHGISFHRFAPALRRPFYYLAEQLGSLLYHRIVSVNTYYARYFALARARGAFDVIPNGITWPAHTPAPAPTPAGEFPILFAGRLDDQKDPLFVLEVAQAIDRFWNSSLVPRFYIAGNGPLSDRVAAEVVSRRLGERVVRLGWVTDLADRYAAAKLIFLPSRWESCGLVLLEAAAFGCPAVAARVEGVPEVVRDGHNGLLFDQGDVEAASRQIARLAGDEPLRLALGARAQQEAAGRSSATMRARYLDLYRQLGLAS
jgi:glycosyltransferase involved in cell wall biosynthesis